jgi:hypothetical protein
MEKTAGVKDSSQTSFTIQKKKFFVMICYNRNTMEYKIDRKKRKKKQKKIVITLCI